MIIKFNIENKESKLYFSVGDLKRPQQKNTTSKPLKTKHLKSNCKPLDIQSKLKLTTNFNKLSNPPECM